MNKKLSKYISVFNYFDKIFIVLSATSGGVSIISFTTIIGAPVGILSGSFSIAFSLTTGIVIKLSQITRNKEKNNKAL